MRLGLLLSAILFCHSGVSAAAVAKCLSPWTHQWDRNLVGSGTGQNADKTTAYIAARDTAEADLATQSSGAVNECDLLPGQTKYLGGPLNLENGEEFGCYQEGALWICDEHAHRNLTCCKF